MVTRMRLAALFTLIALVLGACNKEPEKPKEPRRNHVETQKTSQYIVTIWTENPAVTAGSNAFKLQFQTLDKKPADPGKLDIQPVLVDTGKTPLPGHTELRAGGEPGLYDVIADLPSAGRWQLN